MIPKSSFEFVDVKDGLAEKLRQQIGLAEGEKLRVSYLSLANDVARVQRLWTDGQQDPRTIRATYAGMFFEVVEKLGAEGLMFSKFDTPPVENQPVQIVRLHHADAGYGAASLRDEVERHIRDFHPHLLVASPSVSPDVIEAVSLICPTVYYVHSMLWPTDWDGAGSSVKNRAKRFVRARRSRRQFASLRGAIWESEAARSQAEHVLPKGLHWAKATRQFSCAIETRERSSAKTVLYVGAISEESGLFQLITAFDEVVQKFPQTRLNVLGDGPDAAKLTGLADERAWLDLNLGYDAQKELTAVQQADLLVVPDLPRSMKATPEFLAEALVQGLPALISSSVPATADEMACCARYQAGDQKDLIARLSQLLSDAGAYQNLVAKGPLDPSAYYDRSQSWGSGIARLFGEIYGVS